MWTWGERFLETAGLLAPQAFEAVVDAVASIPYGRPSCRTPEGVLEDGRGTCSTKHMLLALVCADLFPERELRLVNRVYRLDPAAAEQLFGLEVAKSVPAMGLVDVHTYATALVDGARLPIDVTFPRGAPWDGHSPMPLACGPGEDLPAGPNPLASKAILVMERCDPAVREPFIVALTASLGRPG